MAATVAPSLEEEVRPSHVYTTHDRETIMKYLRNHAYKVIDFREPVTGDIYLDHSPQIRTMGAESFAAVLRHDSSWVPLPKSSLRLILGTSTEEDE